jgi:transposase
MIFLIPKKNSHISGRRNWREKIRRFTDDPMNYLREYFRRNTSGSGFS